MIRVLYTTHASNLTGASRSLLDLLSGIKREEVKPIVLLRQKGPLEEKLKELSVTYHVIPHANTILGERSKPPVIKTLFNSVVLSRIVRFIKSVQIDLVHSNSLLCDVGMHAAKKASIPYICHLRELVVEDHNLSFLNEHQTMELASSCDRAVSISNYVRKKFESWFHDNQLITIKDGINCAEYYDRSHKRILLSGRPKMLLAGRFARGKGQLDAICATKELIDKGISPQLILIGSIADGEYYEDCLSTIRNYKLEKFVRVVDFCDDLKVIRADADISLTCSSHEALGRVTVEGMLAGCLAIGANAGATPEIIRDGWTGILYEDKNPIDLANKIEWCLNNMDAANRIRLAGQRYALTEFDVYDYATQLSDQYNEILQK